MQLEPLSPKQAWSIREATARLNIWHGSVRSGKTVASLLWWADRVANWRGTGRLGMVGKTNRALERNALDPLESILGSRAVDVRRGAGEAFILGRQVDLLSAADESSQGKIRGATYEGLYGDEITLWPESFFKMGLSRMSPLGAQFGGTTNPDSPLHWLKVNFIDRAGELNLKAFHFVLADNRTLSPEFIGDLSKEYTGLWRKRFIDGLWVVAEGAIWDAFDTDLHVIDAVPAGVEFRRYVVGIDYGTSNPFVALLLGDGSDGRWYVLDEYRWDSKARMRQKTDAQYSADLKEWIGKHGVTPSTWWVDPSAASFILQARQDNLGNIQAAENEVVDGLRTVATCIAGDRMRVLRRCGGLTGEVQGYRWDEKAQAKGLDQPLKVDDHGPDALRYPVHSESLSPHAGLLGWAKAQADAIREAREKKATA